MSEEFIIRRMKEEEVQIAIDWGAKEGWNPGLYDAECFYRADPKGFFVGLLNGQPIATGAAVVYDDHYAFCGLYVVKPDFRAHGYGLQLTHERLNYVGDRITGLDGVLDKVSKYERLGYVSAHKNIRYALNTLPEFTLHPNVVELQKVSFADVEAFDRRYFPAPRSAFLRGWINQPRSFAFGYVENQKLRGYGVIRKCLYGFKIGPLFAETPSIAQALFESLSESVKMGPVYLDIPEINASAQDLVKYYGMSAQFEVIRMYRNGFPKVDIEGTYGSTTFEVG